MTKLTGVFFCKILLILEGCRSSRSGKVGGGGGEPREPFLYIHPSYDLMWKPIVSGVAKLETSGLSLQMSKRSVFIDNLMKQLLAF